MVATVLGIIGGSGIYDIPMDNARWEHIESPWGEASDAVRRGEIDGLPVVFLHHNKALHQAILRGCSYIHEPPPTYSGERP